MSSGATRILPRLLPPCSQTSTLVHPDPRVISAGRRHPCCSSFLPATERCLLCWRDLHPTAVHAPSPNKVFRKACALVHCTQVRNSVCHSAAIFANAIMHSGTTVDAFLRENLEWLSRATNWAKFSATAGLGVIHRGHLAQVIFR